jgi:hypothetical protein
MIPELTAYTLYKSSGSILREAYTDSVIVPITALVSVAGSLQVEFTNKKAKKKNGVIIFRKVFIRWISS